MRTEQGADKAKDIDLLIGTGWMVKIVCNLTRVGNKELVERNAPSGLRTSLQVVLKSAV